MRRARRSPRLPVTLLLALALLPAGRAWGVKNWYDHYLEARDRHMPAGLLDQSLEALQAAVLLKPQSALKEQTYGLEFVDYLPYYQMGLCYLRKGDFEAAERLFEREEISGAIRKSPLYADLSKRRAEAQNGQRQRLARQVREQAQRLLREADDAAHKGRLDAALATLAEAGTLAGQLNDPELQQAVSERSTRLRAEQQRQSEEAARSRRLEQALSEGQRLLQAGDAAAALVAEPGHSVAIVGPTGAGKSELLRTLEDYFVQHGRFTAGTATCYPPALLIGLTASFAYLAQPSRNDAVAIAKIEELAALAEASGADAISQGQELGRLKAKAEKAPKKAKAKATDPWIPKARLEYLPWARYCVRHQEVEERNRESA